MSLTLLETGLLSLLVDAGRPRSRSLGVPVGGAADRASLAHGNALVGNPPDAVGLEFTLTGPTLEAAHRTACVVFGAPFRISLNQRSVAAGTTMTLEAGDRLRIGSTPAGVRGYLCVACGFDAPEILGSKSSFEPLIANTQLVCPASSIHARSLPFINMCEETLRESPVKLRVLDGPQREWFDDDRFFTQIYDVTPTSNRMGSRLAGEPLTRKPGELVSEPVAPGAIQVTNDGRPVILGVDGQTIGGYPKIAHVIRADLDLLGQLRPGGKVRFVRVEMDEAERAARERDASLRLWLARLRAAQ